MKTKRRRKTKTKTQKLLPPPLLPPPLLPPLPPLPPVVVGSRGARREHGAACAAGRH